MLENFNGEQKQIKLQDFYFSFAQFEGRTFLEQITGLHQWVTYQVEHFRESCFYSAAVPSIILTTTNELDFKNWMKKKAWQQPVNVMELILYPE